VKECIVFLRQNNGSHSQQIMQHCVEYRPMKKL